MAHRKRQRTAPTNLDKKRISETIMNTDRFKKIKDEDSFNEAYDDYFDGVDYWIKKKGLRQEIQTRVFSVRDIKPTPLKEVVMKPKKPVTKKPSKAEFKFTGTERFKDKKKDRIVIARKTFIVVKGKKQTIFRDRKGRFVSVKVKK